MQEAATHAGDEMLADMKRAAATLFEAPALGELRRRLLALIGAGDGNKEGLIEASKSYTDVKTFSLRWP